MPAHGHRQGACGSLGAYINQVRAQSGKKLAAGSAEDLVAEAAAVRGALGCATSYRGSPATVNGRWLVAKSALTTR